MCYDLLSLNIYEGYALSGLPMHSRNLGATYSSHDLRSCWNRVAGVHHSILSTVYAHLATRFLLCMGNPDHVWPSYIFVVTCRSLQQLPLCGMAL